MHTHLSEVPKDTKRTCFLFGVQFLVNLLRSIRVFFCFKPSWERKSLHMKLEDQINILNFDTNLTHKHNNGLGNVLKDFQKYHSIFSYFIYFKQSIFVIATSDTQEHNIWIVRGLAIMKVIKTCLKHSDRSLFDMSQLIV